MNFIKKSTSLIFISVVAIGLLFTSCHDNAWDNHISNDEQLKSDLMEVIQAQPELSTFVTVLNATGYNELLMTSNNFTVFAPTNDAWANVDTKDVESLKKIVSTLIVYNTYFYEDSSNEFKSFKAVNGKTFFYDETTKTINGASIIRSNIRSANGVIQVTDKIVERKENIWDYLSTKTDNLQYQYIYSLDKQIMDMDKSIAIGVYPDGKTKYDTIWKHVNNFLEKYPIESEDSVYTYVIVQNDGFNILYDKYKKYFSLSTAAKTDSLTRFNICQDFVFKGIVDITAADTLTNIDGVKVPFKGSTVIETYSASNGKVYVINQSNIKLTEKIKPIKIEGEDFNNSYNTAYVFTRYRLWASGERDVALAAAETQSDSIYSILTGRRDSIVSRTYNLNSSYIANVNSFYIEYKANVSSANYDIYYVAYDDISSHFDLTHTTQGSLKLVQKLFISMPGSPVLRKGIIDNSNGIANNYLGDSKCFVGVSYAGVHEVTKLNQWSLIPTTQLVDAPTTNDVLTVTRSGQMTMWLTNTALSATSSRQGMLFLDYILLVPRITEE